MLAEAGVEGRHYRGAVRCSAADVLAGIASALCFGCMTVMLLLQAFHFECCFFHKGNLWLAEGTAVEQTLRRSTSLFKSSLSLCRSTAIWRKRRPSVSLACASTLTWTRSFCRSSSCCSNALAESLSDSTWLGVLLQFCTQGYRLAKFTSYTSLYDSSIQVCWCSWLSRSPHTR